MGDLGNIREGLQRKTEAAWTLTDCQTALALLRPNETSPECVQHICRLAAALPGDFGWFFIHVAADVAASVTGFGPEQFRALIRECAAIRKDAGL